MAFDTTSKRLDPVLIVAYSFAVGIWKAHVVVLERGHSRWSRDGHSNVRSLVVERKPLPVQPETAATDRAGARVIPSLGIAGGPLRSFTQRTAHAASVRAGKRSNCDSRSSS